MPLTLAEGAVEQIKGYLAANLPANVDEVNAQYGDVIDIAQPQGYYSEELANVPPTPAVFVMAEDSGPELDRPGAFHTRHRLTVVVVDSDPDAQTLKTRLYRHVLALVNTLIEGRQAAQLRFFWRDPYASYDPIYAGNGAFWSDAQVYIEVSLEEVY